VLLGINPWLGLATLLTWLIIARLLPLFVAGIDRQLPCSRRSISC
jgi:hypothetical protein